MNATPENLMALSVSLTQSLFHSDLDAEKVRFLATVIKTTWDCSVRLNQFTTDSEVDDHWIQVMGFGLTEVLRGMRAGNDAEKPFFAEHFKNALKNLEDPENLNLSLRVVKKLGLVEANFQ